MRIALVNPNWDFEGSVYFGCRQPHLPLEFGYAAGLVRALGHEAFIIDAQMEGLSRGGLSARIGSINPDMTVIATAPSYLFWRCPPPELKSPIEAAAAVRAAGGVMAAAGPHPSVTPGAAIKKLGADIVIMGECEKAVADIASAGLSGMRRVTSVAYFEDGALVKRGHPRVTDMASLPPLRWPRGFIGRHVHHHHRFDALPEAPGAEMEASRGCPYNCTFCSKSSFRGSFRRRPLDTVLQELDGLVEDGAGYVYFIDEIFMPDEMLLKEIKRRGVRFGIQTRVDIWTPEQIDLLGDSGCVSIEAGVESVTEEGRRLLGKRCRLNTAEMTALLVRAKRKVPFVQATLIGNQADAWDEVEEWREALIDKGVWVNRPVPLFPYPGSAEYAKRWGEPDDKAWERAHGHYLKANAAFSDVQGESHWAIEELERSGPQNKGL